VLEDLGRQGELPLRPVQSAQFLPERLVQGVQGCRALPDARLEFRVCLAQAVRVRHVHGCGEKACFTVHVDQTRREKDVQLRPVLPVGRRRVPGIWPSLRMVS
jgi:hypothetical protein